MNESLANNAVNIFYFIVAHIIHSFRVVSYAVPPQEILSKDSVTVSVDAVVYFRTSDPIASVNNVDDAIYSTKLLAQTTLRNALGWFFFYLVLYITRMSPLTVDNYYFMKALIKYK